MNNPKPKKGDAAPLEGAVGPQIASVLNMAFSAIGFGMVTNATLKASHSVGSPAVAANTPKAGAPRMAAPKAAGPKASAPKAPAMR